MGLVRLQVRCGPEKVQCAWPFSQPSLKPAARAAYFAFNMLCQQFTAFVTSRLASPGLGPDLDERMSFDAAEQLSQSNMTLFHYGLVLNLAAMTAKT